MIRPVLAARRTIGGPLAVAAGGSAVWYLAGGAPTPVAAYQPKGAASLAASYVNLANPGTYDAAPGVAPTWDAANGWILNGTTQYLTTGIIPSSLNWSLFARFSGGTTSGVRVVCGAWIGASARFHLTATNGAGVRTYGNGNFLSVSGALTAGVMGFAGLSAYLNGVSDGSITSGGSPSTRALIIGAFNDGSILFFYQGNIQALVVYSSVLDSSGAAAVSAAMAAL